VASSGGGVTLPDGAVRAPDASWISYERWESLDDTGREKYPSVVPDIIVEIVSYFDSYAAQRRKARRYVEQGARCAVVIDPERRIVEIFGDSPDGLTLDVDRIIDAGASAI
jgi:Uma2 family endonuclease